MPTPKQSSKLTKILLVSDTHGDISRLRKIKELHKPDYITHAGDYVYSQHEIIELVDFLVRGNNDEYVPGTGIVEEITFEINGAKFFLCHSHTIISRYYGTSNADTFEEVAKNNGAAYFLYGHTHWFDFTKTKSGIYLLNPGSLSLPRDGRQGSYMLLWIDENGKYVKHEEHRINF